MAETEIENGRRPQQRVNPRAHAERQPDREAPRAERTRMRTRGNSGITQPSHDSYINFENIPPDVSIEWKLYTAVGSEMKNEYPFYTEGMRQQGFEPVDPHEHPDWVKLPPDYPHHNVIVNGLMLMERPKALEIEARKENRQNALGQVQQAEQRLGRNPRAVDYKEGPAAEPHLQKLEKQMMRPIPIEE